MLFNNLTEIFPKQEFSSVRKLEAIIRFLIILTIFCFILTKRVQILFVGILTISIVYISYKIFRIKNKESFVSKKISKMAPASTNPLMNVLLTDYTDNPTRQEAQKSWKPKVEEKINYNAFNPGVYNDSRMFKDLGENMEFEQSMRQFYTTASTTIPNKQDDFGQFCYGNMPSCKEGHPYQCVKNNTKNFKTIY
jgi:hypothetical protein